MNTTYGEWLREKRRARGLDQTQLAAACEVGLGIYQSGLSRWETGEAIPTMAQAVALHAALGVVLDSAAGLDLLLAAEREERARRAAKKAANTEAA